MDVFHFLSAIKDWVLKWAVSPLAPVALFVNAVAEAILFPVPPDLLLIAMCLAAAASGRPHLAFLFALITTVGSVTGGIGGYFLGLKGGRPIAERLYDRKKIEAAEGLYAKYGIWAVAVAGFTPVPYCIFTVLSGVLLLPLYKFIVVSILSRGARFFLVATLIFFFGKPVAQFLQDEKRFGLLTIVFMVLLIGGYLVLHKYSQSHIRKHRERAEGAAGAENPGSADAGEEDRERQGGDDAG
ncbi:MAG: YqaA family protein [Planctomycetota bacterium]|jgi:membrane protein YqaA with SNARE-associated domain